MRDGGGAPPRGLRTLGWSLLGIAAGVAIGALVIHRVLSPERLRAEVAAAARAATALDVELDEAHLSFFPFGISLSGLRLADPREGGRPVVELEAGMIRLDLAPLLRKNVVVERLTLTRLRVLLRREGDRFVLPRGPGAAPSQPEAASRSAPSPRPGDREPHPGAAPLPGVVAGFRGEIRSFEIVEGTLQILTPEDASDITLGGVGLRGSLEVGERPGSVHSRGELALSPLARGRLAAYRETLEALHPVVRFYVEFRRDEGVLELSELHLAASPLDLRFRGRITGIPMAPAISLVLEPQAVELSQLLRLLPPAMLPPGALPGARGLAHLAARAEGPLSDPGSPPAFSARLALEDAALGAGTPQELRVRNLQGTASLGGDDGTAFDLDVTVQVDSLITPGATLRGVALTAAVRGGRTHVETRVGAGHFGGISVPGFEVELDAEGRRVRGDFRSPAVNAHHLPLTDVRGKIDLGSDRVLRIDDVTAALWSGQVEGSARIDLTDPRVPAFDLRTSATGVPASELVPALTPARNILYGTLDLESSFSGRGATADEIARGLIGEGTFTTHRGRIARTPATTAMWKALNLGEREAIPFRDLAAKFSIREGRIHTRDLDIHGGDARWRAAGSVSFEGDLDYDVEVELSEKLSAQYRSRLGGDLAGLLASDSGRLVVDLRITGDASRPRVAVDTGKLAERARRALGASLEGKLRSLLGNGAPAGSTAGPDSAAAPDPAKPLEKALESLLGKRRR